MTNALGRSRMAWTVLRIAYIPLDLIAQLPRGKARRSRCIDLLDVTTAGLIQNRDAVASRSRPGRVRQRGGKSGVTEVAVDHAATVAICGVVASISAGMSSAMGSVCM